MTETTRLGAKMHAARARLGLRPLDAARKIGVSKATYSRWESNEDFPRAQKLPAIQSVLGIPVAEMLASAPGRTSPRMAQEPHYAAAVLSILGFGDDQMTKEDRQAWEHFIALIKVAHGKDLDDDLSEAWDLVRQQVRVLHRRLVTSGKIPTPAVTKSGRR